jgi:hypothetical protein
MRRNRTAFYIQDSLQPLLYDLVHSIMMSSINDDMAGYMRTYAKNFQDSEIKTLTEIEFVWLTLTSIISI